MKPKNLFSLALAFIVVTFTANLSAQTPSQERADSLRLQLEELKNKEVELESRLQVLEEQSKPENIEKSLAGVGSTKPEELRELKRKQFEREKQGVQNQLALLRDSRTRLESGLAQADAAAYQESAKGSAVVSPPSDATVTPAPKQRPRRVNSRRVRTRRSRNQ